MGQLVRLLVDQQEPDRAIRAARRCSASESWCLGILGFAQHARGDLAAADLTFAASAAAMPDSARCRWLDIADIVEQSDRGGYTERDCATRMRIAERFWWLADPLMSSPGNERRAEHFARKTWIALHSALPRDERFHLDPRLAGDALAQMITRYGSPSYSLWMGKGVEQLHFVGYVNRTAALLPKAVNNMVDTSLSVSEYSVGSAHMAASWRAVNDPFSASRGDWTLYAPPETELSDWWPRELFVPRRPIVELRDMQIATLRRDSAILLAVATNARALRRRADETEDRAAAASSLLVSAAPDSIVRVDHGTLEYDGLTVLMGLIPARPVVVGVEVLVDSTAAPDLPDRRLRFGLTPPAALSSSRRDSLVVSEPVLLEAPRVTGAVPMEAIAAMATMLPSTTLLGLPRIGVYWEAYGPSPTDTLDLSVRIVRRRVGFLQVLGGALRLQGASQTLVGISWRETARAAGSPSGARHDIHPFGVALDITRLERGHYELEVAVTKRGGTTARSSRAFELR